MPASVNIYKNAHEIACYKGPIKHNTADSCRISLNVGNAGGCVFVISLSGEAETGAQRSRRWSKHRCCGATDMLFAQILVLMLHSTSDQLFVSCSQCILDMTVSIFPVLT